MQSKFSVPAVLAAALLLTGCNTVAGIGKDLQAGGQALSEASDEVAGSFENASDNSAASGEACDPVGPELKGSNGQRRCR